MDAFHREVERVLRYQHTICLLMMDIDGLKQINDNFGHTAGDVALRAVADILKASVRESDILARLGGDEFVIVMPLADKASGVVLAKRIRERLVRWNVKPVISGITLGLSIGIQEAGPENVNDILKNADKEMYRNKASRKSAEKITSEDEMRSYLRKKIQKKDPSPFS